VNYAWLHYETHTHSVAKMGRILKRFYNVRYRFVSGKTIRKVQFTVSRTFVMLTVSSVCLHIFNAVVIFVPSAIPDDQKMTMNFCLCVHSS
jgi:hypothetical protein